LQVLAALRAFHCNPSRVVFSKVFFLAFSWRKRPLVFIYKIVIEYELVRNVIYDFLITSQVSPGKN
jgi:hypothetical protein